MPEPGVPESGSLNHCFRGLLRGALAGGREPIGSVNSAETLLVRQVAWGTLLDRWKAWETVLGRWKAWETVALAFHFSSASKFQGL